MNSSRLLPKKICTNRICDPYCFVNIIDKRPLGLGKNLGFDDFVYCQLYQNFQQCEHGIPKGGPTTETGGIFNLEFSLDGKLLLGACERKQIVLHDAGNQKFISEIKHAHDSCVNNVRFLNDKHFASCSDDNLIKLWDIRKLVSPMQTLHGHTNWVKNIEWSTEDDVMVTSDFDGNIFSWNLKTANGNSLNYDKVFLMNGLMRMKLTEDGTKMIISTTTGFMIIIHDLNLSTLATDLRFFRPSLYRLMQLSEQCFPVGTVHNYLFSPTRKRNRIEFIDDFPQEAEAISSLQIHPHGWCAVSRNLNGDENQEYTTVHDIQTRDPKDYENAFTTVEEELPREQESENSNNSRPTDLWMGYIPLNEYYDRELNEASQNMWDNFQLPGMGILNSGLIGTDSSFSTYFRQCPEQRTRIIKNLPRMTHFIREKGVGKGFIKELCLSNDGRVIFSPYDKGVRLLGFNYKCQEMLMCIPDKPRQLKIVKEFANRHKDIVVSCKFSPVHHQLVSGCIVGDINWYQPVF
ncbi:DDB1- and CUL4-associated factor 10 [Leptinotarsa decemlineata]|uniref:DDB1- and CUL4-associated factor 10 n=1 Tax=Leptinotarsa decemlineata TaxID=7539 RepID=UPI003D3089CF